MYVQLLSGRDVKTKNAVFRPTQSQLDILHFPTYKLRQIGVASFALGLGDGSIKISLEHLAPALLHSRKRHGLRSASRG